MKAAAICLVLAGLTAAPAALTGSPEAAADPVRCSAPPAPGGATRTVPDGHAKASSFSPSHSKKRAYGAPIPKPIVSRHAKKRHKPLTPPSTAASR